jgi:hypothetical protein
VCGRGAAELANGSSQRYVRTNGLTVSAERSGVRLKRFDETLRCLVVLHRIIHQRSSGGNFGGGAPLFASGTE